MIKQQAKLTLNILILMILSISSIQFAAADSFVPENQIFAVEVNAFSQTFHENNRDKIHTENNSDINTSAITHCPDNQSIHYGGCMLCAAIFILMPDKVDVTSVYQSFYIDRIFIAFLDKEIRPPRA